MSTTGTQGPTLPGQYYDQETKLHYNYHRYYDPAIGRYITSDPIGLRGGMNRYLYANGNPVRFVDPLGLWPLGLPGKSDALKNGPSWVQYYLPETSNQQASDITKEVVDKLRWKDVNRALSEFGVGFEPPKPGELKNLSEDQKDFIRDFIKDLNIPDDVKSKLKDLLEPPEDNDNCPT